MRDGPVQAGITEKQSKNRMSKDTDGNVFTDFISVMERCKNIRAGE